MGPDASLGTLIDLASYAVVVLAGYSLRAFISWRRRNRFR